MPAKLDLTGHTYERWVVLHAHPAKQRYWVCQCACGVIQEIRGDALKLKHSQSCGCWRRDQAATHGAGLPSSSPLLKKTYAIYRGMLVRCNAPQTQQYIRYGARGIHVCERWETSFLNFLADMGEVPSASHSIDRINNDGDYEPTNCRWATSREQVNNRSTTVFLTVGGVTKPSADWARHAGLSCGTLRRRIRRGESGPNILRPSGVPLVNL